LGLGSQTNLLEINSLLPFSSIMISNDFKKWESFKSVENDEKFRGNAKLFPNRLYIYIYIYGT